MNQDVRQIASDIARELEEAWNAADGRRFAGPFAEDADFVNIRGDHQRGREAIAKGHQAIFDGIYKGSVVRMEVAAARLVAPDVVVAHVKNALKAPAGPLAGEHSSLASLVLVKDQYEWRIAAFHNTLVA